MGRSSTRSRNIKRPMTQADEVPKSKIKRPTQSQPEPKNTKGGKKSQVLNASSRPSSSQSSITSYFPQGGQKNASQRALSVSSAELTELANSAAFYMLLGGSTKLPITRTELMKTVLANQTSKFYGPAIEKSAQILMELFGLRLMPIDEKPLERSDKFILVNGITCSKFYLEQESFDQKAHQVLLCLILNCIRMSGGTMQEEHVLEFLTELNIKLQDTSNATFGNVAAKLTAYKAQQYLKYEVNKEHNPPVNQVVWGPRAHAEVSRAELLSFIKEIYPEVPTSGILNMTVQAGGESEEEEEEEEKEDEEEEEEDEEEEEEESE